MANYSKHKVSDAVSSAGWMVRRPESRFHALGEYLRLGDVGFFSLEYPQLICYSRRQGKALLPNTDLLPVRKQPKYCSSSLFSGLPIVGVL